MTIPATKRIFDAIESADLDALRCVFDQNPCMVHMRHTEGEDDPMSALQFAAAQGQLAACRLLVERGAEVYTNPMNTYPPVILAAWNRHTEIVKYFLEEIPHLAAGTNGLGVALNLAGRQGWIDIVRQHLERDPLSVYQRGWIGDTPLHWPAHNNHADIVTSLLDAGAEPEADELGCYGGKPLHWASEHAPASVRVLLQRGANVNSRNCKADSEFFGMTPLHMNATQKEDCGEVTELLLGAGAEIAALDAHGKTALDHARENRLRRIEEVLRRHGAA